MHKIRILTRSAVDKSVQCLIAVKLLCFVVNKLLSCFLCLGVLCSCVSCAFLLCSFLSYSQTLIFVTLLCFQIHYIFITCSFQPLLNYNVYRHDTVYLCIQSQPTCHRSYFVFMVVGMAWWLGHRSLACGLSTVCALSTVDM